MTDGHVLYMHSLKFAEYYSLVNAYLDIHRLREYLKIAVLIMSATLCTTCYHTQKMGVQVKLRQSAAASVKVQDKIPERI